MSFKDILKDMRAVPPVAATTPIHRVERGLACAMEYPRPDKRGDRDALRRIGPDHSAYYDQLVERLSGANLQPGEFESRMGMVATIGLSQWYCPQLHGARLLNIATRPLEQTREAANRHFLGVIEETAAAGDYGVLDSVLEFAMGEAPEGDTIAKRRVAIATNSAIGSLSIGVQAGSYRWSSIDGYRRATSSLLRGPTGYIQSQTMTPNDYMRQGLGGLMRLNTPTLDQQIGIEIPASE